MRTAPFPDDLVKLSVDGIKQIRDGAETGRQAVKRFVNKILELDGQLSDIEQLLNQKCMEMPYAENILSISGIL